MKSRCSGSPRDIQRDSPLAVNSYLAEEVFMFFVWAAHSRQGAL